MDRFKNPAVKKNVIHTAIWPVLSSSVDSMTFIKTKIRFHLMRDPGDLHFVTQLSKDGLSGYSFMVPGCTGLNFKD